MRIGIGRGASMVAAAALVGSAVNAQAPMTVQQQFDAATALTAGSDKTAALAAWTAFEHRIANNPRTLAVVRIRKAAVLLALDRMDEAAADARVGLAALPPKDASLAEDRFTAQFLLGRIAQDAIDYASAAANYRTAEDIAPDAGGKVAAALGVVETDIFVDPRRRRRHLAGSTRCWRRTARTRSSAAASLRRGACWLSTKGSSRTRANSRSPQSSCSAA